MPPDGWRPRSLERWWRSSVPPSVRRSCERSDAVFSISSSLRYSYSAVDLTFVESEPLAPSLPMLPGGGGMPPRWSQRRQPKRSVPAHASHHDCSCHLPLRLVAMVWIVATTKKMSEPQSRVRGDDHDRHRSPAAGAVRRIFHRGNPKALHHTYSSMIGKRSGKGSWLSI